MLSDLHKDKLGAMDEITIGAVKALFDEEINKVRPEITATDDNVLLGQKFRAFEESREIIEKVFINIKSYKVSNVKTDNFAKEL